MISKIFGCLLVGLVMAFATGCSSKASPCTGKERCACYENQTCNAGLTCFSNTCVNTNADAGVDVPIGGTGGVTAGSGGSPGAGGMLGGGAGGSGGGVGGNGGAGETGGNGLGGNGLGGNAAGGHLGGTGGTSGTGGAATGDAGACRLFETQPEATVPTVFVLVDRSGSMFNCLSGTVDAGSCVTAWGSLKTGILQMVSQLQGAIRFGLGAFTGQAMVTCPVFDKISPALNNADAITAFYNSLGAPTFKGETPTSQVLAALHTQLVADPSPGRKYILFVTDGEPDFCDDGDQNCPYDAVVHQLQELKSGGIGTFVFGIQSPLTTLSVPSLQAFANAGAGLGVAYPGNVTRDADLYTECHGSAGWAAEYAASGKTTSVPLASYGGNGSATVYKPDPTNQQALTDLLSNTVAGVKSCTFDLIDGLTVDLSQLDQAHVLIENQEVPHDATNGWTMVTASRLQLSGAACTLWQQPANRSIDIRFPCGAVRPN